MSRTSASATPTTHPGDATHARRSSALFAVATITGSALFWARGFLCYLSPVLLLGRNDSQAAGLEWGFFASQAAVILSALLIVLISRKNAISINRNALFACSVALVLIAPLLAWALAHEATMPIIICGIVDGAASTLIGAAWGARYAIGSKPQGSVIVLSFLEAYIIYAATSALPAYLGTALITLLPLLSWLLWRYTHVDSSSKQAEESSEARTPRSDQKSSTPNGSITAHVAREAHMHRRLFLPHAGYNSDDPNEVTAGSWRARLLPWSAVGMLALAAFAGNLVVSYLMGESYLKASSLLFGGVLVCFCITCMALVPAASSNSRERFSTRELYRITITFSAIGFVALMVFGKHAIGVGGAFVQGCALFFQVIIYITVAHSTQAEGHAPLLSFGIGQAVVAGVVLVSHLTGKAVVNAFGQSDFVLDVICGISLLALVFLLVASAENGSPADLTASETAQSPYLPVHPPEETILQPTSPAPVPVQLAQIEESTAEHTARFAQAFSLTKRETEVLSYLARGRSLPYIAEELFVTTGTIKTHVAHIYRKVAVNSRQELLDALETF